MQVFYHEGYYMGSAVLMLYLAIMCWFGERLVKWCQMMVNGRRNV